jgi:hypothetical protein
MNEPRFGRERLPRLRSQTGQVEVETAIVLPMVVFLLLGLLQMGLLQQARLFAEYAAYKAVRTGALQNLDQDAMERAAVAAALPILSFGKNGGEVLAITSTPTDWVKKWMRFLPNRMFDAMGMKYAEVVLCGPKRSDVPGTYSSDGDGNVVPFDNPEVAGRSGKGTHIRLELTLNYRLVVPFADYVIHRMWLNKDITDVLRVDQNRSGMPKIDRYSLIADTMGVYIVPIRAQYSMKLMSDAKIDKFPQSNDCVVK